MTTKLNLPATVGKLFELLEPHEAQDRQKIVRSALTLLGAPAEVGGGIAEGGFQAPDMVEGGEVQSLGKKAQLWIKRNDLTSETLQEVFHLEGESVEVIANEIPGEGKKTKSHNCYLISGVRALLATDEPKFSDSEAVDLCKAMACHDAANHATTRKALGNIVAGSKSAGFTLSGPGQKAAAELIKQMGHAA